MPERRAGAAASPPTVGKPLPPYEATFGCIIGRMRLAVAVVVLLLATGTAWTTSPVSLTPPRCSPTDTKQQKTLTEPEPRTGQLPIYFRFCGPARARVRVNGRAYDIQGGFCYRGPGAQASKRKLMGIGIGLIANKPARPGFGVTFFWVPPSTDAALVAIDDSEIEVPGRRVAASGSATVAKSLNSGSFRLYGRTESGLTGDRVTGTWTCG